MTSLQEDAASFASEDLNSRSGSYDMERSRIDERNKHSHLYQNDDEYLTKKNITRCCIATLVVLFFVIIIIAIANSENSTPGGGGGDIPDTWTPAFVDPPIGPYSSDLCEEYLNKNLTHPSNRELATFSENEDWTLKEIWVY